MRFKDNLGSYNKLANIQLFSFSIHASHESVQNGEVHNMMRLLVEEIHKGSAIDLKQWLNGITSNNMTMMITKNR
jgi:hypothetical protein